MYIFLDEIEKRIGRLKQIIEEKEIALRKAPKGVINIATTEEKTQYYYKESSSDRAKKYVRNSETHIVEELCQKDYDQRVFLAAQKELKRLEKLMGLYPMQMCEEIYGKLNEHRKCLVQPIEVSDEEFVRDWMNVPYEKMGFAKDDPEYYTDNGERVRSKTEIIIANTLKKYGIPYRYEYPVYLNGFGWVYPDFVTLNIRLRKEFYWEHLGMMDNADYAEKNLNKITNYEKNDIFPGDKLIVTHETSRYPINSRIIEKIIHTYLL